MVALFESALAEGPASGALWQRLTTDTGMLADHLQYLADAGRPLPGDPVLLAAAMGGMLSMLAYALPPAEPDAAGPSAGGTDPGYPDGQILDTLTRLLRDGLAGRPPTGRG
jgi:hypothetical protein